jgi:hypothetical protein
MRLFSLFLLFVSLTACQPTQQKAHRNPIAATDTLGVSKLQLHLPDTVTYLLQQSTLTDTFEYYSSAYADTAPYPFIYFKAGKIFDKKQKSGIALYSLNDTTVIYETYADSAGQWKHTGSREAFIYGFHPAFFMVFYADYNFDGYKDLYTIYYSSNGLAYSYGYLLTYKPRTRSLKLHPESAEIADMEPHSRTRTVISEMMEDRWSDVIVIHSYKWAGDSLKFIGTRKKK